MNILAIDPATKCGWAIDLYGNRISGTWDLSPKRDESKGMRLVRFKSKLDFVVKDNSIALVVFEAARNVAPRMQGALVVQAEIQGVLKAYLEENNIEYRGYSPTEVKKHATGKGNANKAMMIQAAKDKGWDPEDDNAADALWILDMAIKEYTDG